MAEGTPIVIKKKKVHAAHAHHGGSWKVAYADFVTAMMAFFMVMWIMGLSQDKKNLIAAYFKDPIGFSKNEPKYRVNVSPKGAPASTPSKSKQMDKDPVKKDEDKIRELKKKIEKAIQSDSQLAAIMKDIEITVTSEGLRIELVEATGAVFFESGSAVVRPAALELVKRIGTILGGSKRDIVVEGHTDATPYPSSSYDNWNLSQDRADAMRRAVVGAGVSMAQIKGVNGYAATRLKNKADPASFANRRVSLLLPFAQSGNIDADLPAAVFKDRIQGAFRNPVEIAPDH